MVSNACSTLPDELNENYYCEEPPKVKGGSDDHIGNGGRGGFPRARCYCLAGFVFIFLAAVISLAFQRTVGSVRASPEKLFNDFVHKYGKRYASPEHMQIRRAIFEANLVIIQAANKRGNPYTLAVNEFADLTAEEFQASHLGFMGASTPSHHWSGLPNLGAPPKNITNKTLPVAVDWTAMGAVTTVKNQGQCGSCWAFSTVAALEGAWQIASGRLVNLSEQQLIDCSTRNHACGGGAMDLAFEDMEGKAICSEEDYSYQGKSLGICNITGCERLGLPKGALVGYTDVPPDDEQALMEAVARQPVSVAIEADQLSLQLYGSGVLTKECGNSVNHAVLIVGYGSENGVKYWKVKNSWGSNWGEGGYVKIERGLKGDGQCGINSMASYPIVKKLGSESVVV